MQIIRKHQLGITNKYIYLLAFIISLVVLFQVSNTREGKLQVVLGDLVYYFSNYFVWAYFINYINGIIQPDNFKNKTKGLITFIIGVLLLALFHLVITNVFYYSYILITTKQSIGEVLNSFKPYILKALFSRIFDLTIIIVLLRILDTYQKLQDKKLQVFSLEKDLHQSQLQSLQSQLNPHFLFNALHTLNTLIGYDDDKARSMVIKITHLLRQILTHKETPYITLREELEYFKNYLDIEQERFNDRLTVITNIASAANSIKVPTLVLQPLIENAFKHGVSQIDGKAEIELKAEVKEKDLLISLKNSIPSSEGNTVENSTKIGLKNLQQRLETIFKDNFEFSALKNKDKFIVTILLKGVN